MNSLATDVDFNGDIMEGVLRIVPNLDWVRAQDSGLDGAEDPQVLAWAAGEGRLLFTHDHDTMIGYAYQRIAAGYYTPGVFAVRQGKRIGRVIDDMVLIVACSDPAEWEDRVVHLPLP